MSDSFASVCVLSYERPQLLRACLESLRDAGAPFELIVHDDGSRDSHVKPFLGRLYDEGLISTLIMQPPGHNEGVGEAVRKCFAVAQGDLLIKVDQDLVFEHDWLLDVRQVLFEEPSPWPEGKVPGCAGLFKYHHPPCEFEKTKVHGHGGWWIVEDFVGSAFAVPRYVYELDAVGPIEAHADSFSEDVGLKKRIKDAGYDMVIPDSALALNVGFGYGPSTVCVEPDNGHNNGGVAKIEHGPVVLDGEWS